MKLRAASRYHRDIRDLKRRSPSRHEKTGSTEAETRINITLYHPEQEQYHNCQELLADLLEARHILINERFHQELLNDL
ncbi:MAG: hypothetical protein IPL27_18415 [Lewinellaceae bacterium]|nr:hypothetical protein [Lewinellaceae bacterium]